MVRRSQLAILALIALALPATVLAMQSGSADDSNQIFRTHEQIAARIYDFDGTPVKLNTTTGAIHSLRGSAEARGTGGHWWLNVPAVEKSGSGMFEIQRTTRTGMDGVFLVDVQSGSTWLLRWRGNQNGSWRALPEKR